MQRSRRTPGRLPAWQGGQHERAGSDDAARGSSKSGVAAWLESESGAEVPDWLLAAVFDQTRHDAPAARRAAAPGPAGGATRLAVRRATEPAAAPDRSASLASSWPPSSWSRWSSVPWSPSRLSFGRRRRPLRASRPRSPSRRPWLELTLDGDAIPRGPGRHPVLPQGLSDRPGDRLRARVRAARTPSSATSSPGRWPSRPGRQCRSSGPARTWADAEIVAAGKEALIGPGDTFVMQDVPFDLPGLRGTGDDGDARRRRPRRRLRHPRVEPLLRHDPRRDAVALVSHAAAGGPGAAWRPRSRCASPAGTCPPAPTCRRSSDGTLALRAVDVGTISGTIVPARRGVRGRRATRADVRRGQRHPAPQDARGRRHGAPSNDGAEAAVVYQLDGRSGPDRSTRLPHPPLAVVTESGPDAQRAQRPQRHRCSRTAACCWPAAAVAEVEVYDPATGTSEPAGEMGSIRSGTTTLLADSRVLLAGGERRARQRSSTRD